MTGATRRARSLNAAAVAVAVLIFTSIGGPVPVFNEPGTRVGAAGKKQVGSDAGEGKRLFRKETFAGNGRTCETCHSPGTGTLSPSDVQERFAQDPFDPLFLHDALDDGVQGTFRITEHATIRIELPLPPTIRIAEDPSATSVVLVRGIPTTINTPALDPSLMYEPQGDHVGGPGARRDSRSRAKHNRAHC